MREFFQQKNDLDNPFFVADVVANNDPTNNYRVKVRIPEIHGSGIKDEQLPWAAKLGSSFLGINGSYFDHSVPEIGTKVLILAIGNDLNSLVYLGSLYKNTDSTPSGGGYTGSFGIYTAKGEFIGVDKISRTLQLIYEGHINIDRILDATINVKDFITVTCTNATVNATNTTVNSDSSTINASTMTINAETTINGTTTINGDVTINGNESVIGIAHAINYDAHTHTGNLGAPTSPPDQ